MDFKHKTVEQQEKQKRKSDTWYGKLWYFIWEEDSLLSWIVNIILAFVIIKFVVYPGLGLILATENPIVAVVSGSMEHDGSFDEWWSSSAICGAERCSQEKWYSGVEITKEQFKTFRFKNGFNIGDIIVLKGRNPKNINVGDVLVFNIGKPIPIIHRVVERWEEGNEFYFATKGDHNPGTYDAIGEGRINQSQIVGEAWFRIPYLGYVKIWFVELLKLFNIVE